MATIVLIWTILGVNLAFDKARVGHKLDWIGSMKTCIKVPIQMCWEEQGRPYDMKWVDTLKPDGRTRCRLVVREIKARKKQHEKLDPSEKLAAMPPH